MKTTAPIVVHVPVRNDARNIVAVLAFPVEPLYQQLPRIVVDQFGTTWRFQQGSNIEEGGFYVKVTPTEGQLLALLLAKGKRSIRA
jgi:hypothetical protein